MSQNQTPSVPSEWLTHAERTDYRETPRYAETVQYAKRLDQASLLIKYETFGKSGEGRDLPLLVATEGETFTPAAARHAGKAVVLIQAHSRREPDGRMRLALLPIAITKTQPGYSETWSCSSFQFTTPTARARQPVQPHQPGRACGDGLAHHQHLPEPEPRSHEG